MEQEKQIITSGSDESQNNVVDLIKVPSETESSMVTRTIDKTTYVVGLHFKEQGLTFSEVLKRVLKEAR
jgi:hypothetical protein